MKATFLKSKIVIGLFAITMAVNLMAVETYNIVPSKSTLAWEGKKVGGAHNGTVDVKGGSVVVEGEAVESGSFEIDMNSIAVVDIKKESMNKKLVGHLKADDFFAVDKHPVSVFKINSVVVGASGSTVKGDLTIKGITHKIEFPAEINKQDNGYHVTASFDIDRSKWDIRYKSAKFFPSIGDKMIYDEINYELDLVFEK